VHAHSWSGDACVAVGAADVNFSREGDSMLRIDATQTSPLHQNRALL
jgi:hypothetical protein